MIIAGWRASSCLPEIDIFYVIEERTHSCPFIDDNSFNAYGFISGMLRLNQTLAQRKHLRFIRQHVFVMLSAFIILILLYFSLFVVFFQQNFYTIQPY